MMYKIEYGLYNIIHEGICGGRIFINASNIEQAQSRATRVAHSLFFRKANENRTRFLSQKKVYEKVIKDLHLPNTWDKWDATWEYVNNLYWSMIDDYVWYKVEEAPDIAPSLIPTVEEWEEF